MGLDEAGRGIPVNKPQALGVTEKNNRRWSCVSRIITYVLVDGGDGWSRRKNMKDTTRLRGLVWHCNQLTSAAILKDLKANTLHLWRILLCRFKTVSDSSHVKLTARWQCSHATCFVLCCVVLLCCIGIFIITSWRMLLCSMPRWMRAGNGTKMMTNGATSKWILWVCLLACCLTPCNAAEFALVQSLKESCVEFMSTRDNPVYNLAWLLLLFCVACLWDRISGGKRKTKKSSGRKGQKIKKPKKVEKPKSIPKTNQFALQMRCKCIIRRLCCTSCEKSETQKSTNIPT